MERGHPVLPAVCVMSLTSFYTQGPQDFENVKETLIQILNVCGLHASTQPMASLAVAMVQCWTMFEMQLPQPDDRITIDSLGVRTPIPRSFSNLPCALGSANDLARLEHAARKASQTLLAWQWAEGSTDLPDDLVDAMTDVKLALEDVVFILQAAGQIKS